MLAYAMAAVLLVAGLAVPAIAFADEGLTTSGLVGTQERPTYTYDAAEYDGAPGGDGGAYPGVFKATLDPATEQAGTTPTIGISCIADATLTVPTTKSPAIICGSAVNWYEPDKAKTKEQIEAEGKENARMFTAPSPNRVAPYSYFKYTVTNVMEADGKTPKLGPDGNPINKLTGFDGTYVIVRIDVSALWAGVAEADRDKSYLHISQDKNNALLVAVGMDKIGERYCSFSNLYAGADGKATTQYQRKTASYKLSEMYDADGKDTTTPYFDVVLFSTASIVSGADAQKEGALNGDVELSLYIDQEERYNDVVWDPANQEPTHAAECFARFYNEDKATEANARKYVVKGSDLALETMVANSDGNLPGGDDTHTTYWSFTKSLQDTFYDQEIDERNDDEGCGRTIGLMSEVPVVDNLELIGESATKLRKRTLDVNSFDIQIANNTSQQEGQYTSGLALKNAWLMIVDNNNTTGAELAVGNNATMTIDTGGKFIVGETCQLEIEWDGATTQPAAEGQQAAAADILNNGALNILEGGEVRNDGVITIEGTEGKPYQPGSQQQASEASKGQGEMTICKGATLTNNGCFMPNGSLYVQGKLVNNGHFNDEPLVSNDPDKGQFTYHRGIQCTWKDDVTQSNIVYGGIFVGMDKTWSTVNAEALLENNGDIVLCPGVLVNEGILKNMPGGCIYSCATDKAVIPIEPDPNNPTVVTKEVLFDEPKGSYIYNWSKFENHGVIRPAQMTVTDTGSLGALVVPGNYDDWFSFTSFDGSSFTGQGFIYKHDLNRATIELKRKTQVLDSVVYNGSSQLFDVAVSIGDSVYQPGTAYQVSYRNSSGTDIKDTQIKDAGEYQVVLKGKETFWGTATKTFTVKPATITSATLSKTTFTYNNKVQKPSVTSVKAGSMDATYTVTWSNDNPKDAGTYTATVKGTGNFTGSIAKSFTINKAANTMKLKGKTAKVKAANLKKKNQVVKRAKAFTVSKAKGKLSYKLASVSKAKFKKYFTVNASNGNITVKKGLTKGTYSVKVSVKAAGDTNYKSATKKVTCKVSVA